MDGRGRRWLRRPMCRQPPGPCSPDRQLVVGGMRSRVLVLGRRSWPRVQRLEPEDLLAMDPFPLVRAAVVVVGVAAELPGPTSPGEDCRGLDPGRSSIFLHTSRKERPGSCREMGAGDERRVVYQVPRHFPRRSCRRRHRLQPSPVAGASRLDGGTNVDPGLVAVTGRSKFAAACLDGRRLFGSGKGAMVAVSCPPSPVPVPRR